MRGARERCALVIACWVTGCTAIVDFGGLEPYPDGGDGKDATGRSAAGNEARGAGGAGGETTDTGGADSEGGAVGTGSRSDGGASDAGGRSSDGGASDAGGRSSTSGGRAAASGGKSTATGGRAAASGGRNSTGGATGNGGMTADGGAMAAGGCSARKWYADADDDQFGDDGNTAVACTAPAGHWVLLGGDCNDGNGDVHPATSSAPIAFHGGGYTNGLGQETFDYDCSGQEDGDPSQQEVGACSGLASCDQGVQGYVSRTDRAGATIDAYCGSTTTVTCAKLLNLLLCGEMSRTDSQPPRRCR